MKIFGHSMIKNIQYEEAKKKLDEYIKENSTLYEWLKDTCRKYDNAIFEQPDFAGFNYEKALKFIRTWDIINNLPADKKNLFLLFCSTGYDYKETLEVFNGVGKGCKNVSTLRVLISNIRKIIREKYTLNYGDSETIFNKFDSDIYC